MLGKLFKKKDTDQSEEARVAPASTPKPVEISREKIAQRAYQIWCDRGQPQGTADEDWLTAEAELRAERSPGRANVKKSR